MKLYRYFEDWRAAFLATARQLSAAGIEPEIAEIFLRHREKLDLNAEAEKLRAHGIGLLTFTDSSYPKLLLETEKFPPLLYYRGALGPGDELCLAMVGTRMVTTYGRLATPRLAGPLAEAGAIIVSGMAFGVDALAHQAAVERGRRTIAVLGGGLDEKSLYPKAHGLLAQQILDTGGMLLSEYPPLTPNFKQNFVARNRIISGMSVATVVIECNLKSGSLITAKYALEQNRGVYAVPGPIYAEQSQGPNNLIKMGAKLVTDAIDILEDLNLQHWPEQQQAQSGFDDSPAEAALLQVVAHEPLHINEIVRQSQLSLADATSALTFLEMKGKIKNLGGQQYVLSR
ncbi:MAG: DNA-processing protein DprA [Patescibacteria group bacterium]|nr:DNA-processing protein DprA [Patescibacteria group bacterium]